jgi:hypothetical protein
LLYAKRIAQKYTDGEVVNGKCMKCGGAVHGSSVDACFGDSSGPMILELQVTILIYDPIGHAYLGQ